MRAVGYRESDLPVRVSYTSPVPCDVRARVLSNTRLSSEYNVVALDAPEIGERSEPGQFVMVKPARGLDPLLRRPFSLFEVLRAGERPIGFSILNKRIGPTTRLLYDLEAGDDVQTLGPVGRPFVPVSGATEAWMIAGGVGLAPFATLGEALAARHTPTRLFYGARRGDELFSLDLFDRLGVKLDLATEDGTRGAHGRITVPLEAALAATSPDRDVALYACGPEPMLAAVSRLAGRFGRHLQVSVERVMGCGLGGCYSCVVPLRTSEGPPHFVRSCLSGPVFPGDQIVW
jgi:dihydroorotate dehydrogenase electron transfer subunit